MIDIVDKKPLHRVQPSVPAVSGSYAHNTRNIVPSRYLVCYNNTLLDLGFLKNIDLVLVYACMAVPDL